MSTSLNATQTSALQQLSTAKTAVVHRSGQNPTNPHHKTLTALEDLGYATRSGSGYVITPAGKAALKDAALKG